MSSMAEPYSLTARIDLIRDHFAALAAALPHVPDELSRAGDTLAREIAQYGVVHIFLLVLGFAALGLCAEFLFRAATSHARRRIAARRIVTVIDRLRVIAFDIAFTLGAIAAFALGSLGAFLSFAWPPLLREIVLGALILFVAVRLAMASIRGGGAAGRFWRVRISLFLGWLVLGLVCVGLLDRLAMQPEIRRLIAYALALGLLAIALETTWQRPGHRRGAWFATFYLVVLWLVWVGSATPQKSLFWTLVIAAVLPAAIRVTGRTVRSLLAAPAEHDTATGSYVLLAVCLERGLRAAWIVGAAVFLAEVWGIPFGELTASDTPVTRLARGALSAVVIVLVADFAWSLMKAAFDRALERATDAGETDAEELRRHARLRTLLPIARNVVFIIVAVMAVLMVLASLGVEIGPLIAGAGVVGVAIGFGAQTIVKDVISGVFYLLDDAFRVGEYIQASGHKGTVESFSLRSVKLRHHRGPLTTVPFGELGAIENMSRDWVIDKLTIGVTYDTNLDAAKKIIKEIGKELTADPEFQGKLIETLKMQGVEQFGDFAIQLRLKMKTKPGEQFVIRRRAYALIKKAFDANGIKFAYPTVQVASGEESAAAAAKRGLELVASRDERP
jgi:small-conductance mechanosensitive channel